MTDFPLFVSNSREDPNIAWFWWKEQADRKLFQKRPPTQKTGFFVWGGKIWYVEFVMTTISHDGSGTHAVQGGTFN